MLHTFLNDIRTAWRGLVAAPSFTAVAVVTIALGIGVNTGIFSLLNALALRELPVPGADELVTINQQVSGVERGSNNFSEFSTAEYETYRDRSRTLSGVSGYARYWVASLGPDDRRTVVSTPVTCDYFDVLQQRPRLGTGFEARHCADAGESAATVITHALWVERFGADPAILGRTLTLNGSVFTVIGVAPEGFAGVDIEQVSLFVPVAAQPLLSRARNYVGDPSIGWLGLVGRRAENASLAQTRAELEVIAEQLDREQPGRKTVVTVSRATPLSAAEMRRNFLTVSPLLLAPFALVLLVACMNVANLLLARGEARLREMADQALARRHARAFDSAALGREHRDRAHRRRARHAARGVGVPGTTDAGDELVAYRPTGRTSGCSAGRARARVCVSGFPRDRCRVRPCAGPARD